MSIEAITEPVLVTGATGKQGGAVAAALLERGVPVRALVRDPGAAAAIALRARGAVLVRGDFDDPASLRIACEGARAVFSVQHPNMVDLESDSERKQGKNLVEAAQAAFVPQFIHTSVSGAGAHHQRAPGWELELASERLIMREIARALARALDLPIEAPSLTADEAIVRGVMPMVARSHARLNHHGSPATPEAARALGIPLTDFETWLRHHPV